MPHAAVALYTMPFVSTAPFRLTNRKTFQLFDYSNSLEKNWQYKSIINPPNDKEFRKNHLKNHLE